MIISRGHNRQSDAVLITQSVLLVLLLFAAVLLFAGVSVTVVFGALIRGSWGSTTSVIESFVKAAPICLCAVCAALPGRLGLINLGGEGQLLCGAMGATGVALLAPAIPSVLLLLLMAGAAIAAGAFWGLLPGAMRALTRTSETVSSLLLNYVAALLLLFLIHGPWRDPSGLGWAQTAAFPSTARLPILFGSQIHLVVLLTPILVAICWWTFRRTTLGRSSRVIAASEATARLIGLKPGVFYTITFAVSGALAGLGGFGEVAAIQGRLREGVSLGYGFSGFLVAWLCRNRFEWLPLGALLIGSLISAGDEVQVTAGLPFATIHVIQGLILIALTVRRPTAFIRGEASAKGYSLNATDA